MGRVQVPRRRARTARSAIRSISTFCGAGECATDPDPTAIACIGFGPQKGLGTLTSGGFAFAQETTAHFRFPDDVYDELPVRGIILWNSHAFNLTRATARSKAG